MLVIKAITTYELNLKLKQPFKTAHDVTWRRPITLVKIDFTNGESGIGEIASFIDDSYTRETHAMSVATLAEIAPKLIGQVITDIPHFTALLLQFTDLSFIRAALEMAVWDAFGKVKQQSLAKMLGATKANVKVGIALGMANSSEQLLAKVALAVEQGYQRIKLKVDAKTPVEWLIMLTKKYPKTMFSVDANASWQANDMQRIKQLDDAKIYLLEQPFKEDEIKLHQMAQQECRHMKISLDESLNNLADVEIAISDIKVGALTIKQAKMGGISYAQKAINLAQQTQVLPWIGGMLSSGVGRAADLALAALPDVDQFPCDSSASSRYFEQDIIVEQPQVTNGQLPVPQQPGLGITIDWKVVETLQPIVNIYT